MSETVYLKPSPSSGEWECFKGSTLLLHCQVKMELMSDCLTETPRENFYFKRVAAPFA